MDGPYAQIFKIALVRNRSLSSLSEYHRCSIVARALCEESKH